MQTLGAHHLRKVLGCVQELYEPVTQDEFGTHLANLISRLIPGSQVAFDEINPRKGTYRLSHTFQFSKKDEQRLFQRLTEVYQQHPIYEYIRKGGEEMVVDMTDLWPLARIHRTDLYHDVFHPAGIEHQIAVQVPIAGYIISLSVNRDRKFDRSAGAMLHILAPHIARAYEVAQVRSAHTARSPFDVVALAAAGISTRELEVLDWMDQGKRNSEIAQIVGVSPRTVEKHVENVMRKLGAETRTAAVRHARELGKAQRVTSQGSSGARRIEK